MNPKRCFHQAYIFAFLLNSQKSPWISAKIKGHSGQPNVLSVFIRLRMALKDGKMWLFCSSATYYITNSAVFRGLLFELVKTQKCQPCFPCHCFSSFYLTLLGWKIIPIVKSMHLWTPLFNRQCVFGIFFFLLFLSVNHPFMVFSSVVVTSWRWKHTLTGVLAEVRPELCWLTQRKQFQGYFTLECLSDLFFV